MMYNLDEFKVWNNGTVHVIVHALDAITFDLVFYEWIECMISSGEDSPGVGFYTFSSQQDRGFLEIN